MNCNNVTVEHLTLTNLLSTVVFAYVSNSKITANNIVSVRNGVDVDNCSNNEITGNTITVPYNPEAFQNYGLSVSSSVNNMITRNTIIGGFSGLLLGTNVTQYNDIYGNTISNGFAEFNKPTPHSSYSASSILRNNRHTRRGNSCIANCHGYNASEN